MEWTVAHGHGGDGVRGPLADVNKRSTLLGSACGVPSHRSSSIAPFVVNGCER